MSERSRHVFLALVLAQALHSTEEYATRLYDVFAPARFVAGLLSDDLATGFLLANAAILVFGLWCYVARVRAGEGSAEGWVWLWVLIELGNGTGHLGMAAARGGYFPGAATAPLLLVLSLYLLRDLSQSWRRRL